MKTTFDLPTPLLRRAKALSATRGESLKEFVTVSIQLRINGLQALPETTLAPPWMAHIGGLAHLKSQRKKLEQDIAGAFDVVDVDLWK